MGSRDLNESSFSMVCHDSGCFSISNPSGREDSGVSISKPAGRADGTAFNYYPVKKLTRIYMPSESLPPVPYHQETTLFVDSLRVATGTAQLLISDRIGKFYPKSQNISGLPYPQAYLIVEGISEGLIVRNVRQNEVSPCEDYWVTQFPSL